MIWPRLTFPLLVATLALSLCAVALIVRGTLNHPSADLLAQACAEALEHSSNQYDSCPEVSPPVREMITINPTTNRPGFAYPLGWYAIQRVQEGRTHIALTSGDIYDISCTNDCGTQNEIVSMVTEAYTLTPGQTLDAYIQTLYGENTQAIIKKETQENGTRYTINGYALENPFGPFTRILFFGATTQVSVLLPESDLFAVAATERTAFLSSLDFSLIP